MKNFTILFSFIFLALLISCGRNEPEKTELDSTEASSAIPSHVASNTQNINKTETTEYTTESATTTENENFGSNSDSDSGLAAAIQRQIPNSHKPAAFKSSQNNTFSPTQPNSHTAITKKEAEVVINSPLRNLLKTAEVGKTYSKKELIENYKFPKEAVDLIKKVTCVGPNKLFFNWGSTWFVEKVSDAEFQNDTMIIAFKKNKTYVSGGAIGIKYNKKIYTELILNNGSAYIPSVKGYHWEINK